MSLQGSLRDFPVADVFQMVAQQRKTGVLEVEQAGRALLITDGNGGWEGLDPTVEVMRITGEAPNAGFVAADLDRKPGTTKGAAFFYRIASSVKKETVAELELRHQERGLARLLAGELSFAETVNSLLPEGIEEEGPA